MSYVAGTDEQQQAQQTATPLIPAEHRFFPVLSNLTDRLADGLDHPEVWPLLAEASRHEDVVELRELIAQLRGLQSERVEKSLRLLGGFLHALSVDRHDGVTYLRAMMAAYPHCPQIAGAIFFLDRQAAGKSADLSNRFCSAPFTKFQTLLDGTISSCCSIWTQQRLGNLDDQTFEEIWNGAAAQAMRESILDGSYRYCNKERCIYINEDTLPLKEEVSDPALRAVLESGATQLENGPDFVVLAHDLTCNLSCPSCRDKIVAADEAQEARFEVIEQQVIYPLLHSPNKVEIAVSGQGDPWSSPHYRSILRYVADNELDVALQINTNALLMDEVRWARYLGLERYRPLVNVSLDACTPWVYEVVRRPGKWERLYPNLEFLARKFAAGAFSALHLNATVQLDNYHELPGLVRLAQTLGADSVRLYMIQMTGSHLDATFARNNVADPAHDLHEAFLETLRNPILDEPVAHLYDVAHWRAHAFEATLPSDALGTDYGRADLIEAIRDAAADPLRRVALCAAGRIRFPDDAELLWIEATSLRDAGFPQQADYRLAEAAALGREAVVMH
ncbi:SPASM domain-containing protein [Sphingomonas azotifigens]|uniref:SPASM domain-containing protein n=1 Tax=Sphingomonas azotifigens TaxID=330920 RepID=UPI000A05E0B0|nr:SPASM domain-containing protein [Sphingomonas azotifigens]